MEGVKKALTLEVEIPALMYEDLAIIADERKMKVEDYIVEVLKTLQNDFCDEALRILGEI